MSEAAVQLHSGQHQFSPDQISLIKQTVAKGTTNDELALFLYTAKRTGLDPLMKQIHAIKRWSKKDNREVMSIQTGIDGLRLIADRTERYAPGPEPVIEEKEGRIVKATAYVKKWVSTEWHTIGATAYYEEYVQTKDGHAMGLWAKMPRLMTAKCAEALALRKAFPAEMSGVYTFDEMTQADSEPPQTPVSTPATASQDAPGGTISPTVTIGAVQIPLVPPDPVHKEADSSSEQNDARDELALVCSKIADIMGMDAGSVLYQLTINKAGKFGKRSPNDIQWEANGPKGIWYPLKAVLSKAKKQLEELQKPTDDDVIPEDDIKY